MARRVAVLEVGVQVRRAARRHEDHVKAAEGSRHGHRVVLHLVLVDLAGDKAVDRERRDRVEERVRRKVGPRPAALLRRADVAERPAEHAVVLVEPVETPRVRARPVLARVVLAAGRLVVGVAAGVVAAKARVGVDAGRVRVRACCLAERRLVRELQPLVGPADARVARVVGADGAAVIGAVGVGVAAVVPRVAVVAVPLALCVVARRVALAVVLEVGAWQLGVAVGVGQHAGRCAAVGGEVGAPQRLAVVVEPAVVRVEVGEVGAVVAGGYVVLTVVLPCIVRHRVVVGGARVVRCLAGGGRARCQSRDEHRRSCHRRARELHCRRMHRGIGSHQLPEAK